MSWRVLGVATVSLWGIFLLARGNLELANAPTNLPAMQETWVQSLGWKHTLEKEMAMHSSTPAWRIPGGVLVGYSPWDCKGSDMTVQLTFTFLLGPVITILILIMIAPGIINFLPILSLPRSTSHKMQC